jgi:hypothetical protein
MIDRLAGAMKARSAQMMQGVSSLRYGIVTNVNPVLDQVKVTLQPEGTQTAWLPIIQLGASNKAGASMVLSVGDQVALLGEGLSNTSLAVLGPVHSTEDLPPAPPAVAGTDGTVSTASVPRAAGEFVVVTPTGQVIRAGAAGIYLKGNVMIDGPLIVNGDVSDQHGKLDVLRRAYNEHVHGSSPTTSIPVSE